MSISVHSAPARLWQAFSFVAVSVALAANYVQFASALTGVDWWIATGSVAVIEAGLLAASWALFPALKAGRGGVAALSLALASICAGNALAGGFGAAWTRYASQRDARVEATSTYSNQVTRVSDIRHQLDALAAVRPTAVIQANLNDCRKCAAGDRWRRELQHAEKRDGLSESLATEDGRLRSLKAVNNATDASPPAAFIHAALGIDHEKTEIAIMVLYVLLLQLAAPLAAAIAGCKLHSNIKDVHMMHAPTAQHDARPDAPADTQADAPTDTQVDAPTYTQPDAATSNATSKRALIIAEMVKDAGGTLHTTQRDLADRMGKISPISVGHAIKAAAGAGMLKVIASRSKGTTLMTL